MKVSPTPSSHWILLGLVCTGLLIGGAACTTDKTNGEKVPWAKQSRREIERDWWLQNRYDDTRPSALNPGEHR